MGADDFGVSVSLQVPCELLVLLRFLPLPVSVLNIIVLLVSDPFFSSLKFLLAWYYIYYFLIILG